MRNFLEKSQRIKNHTVADDAFASWPQNTAGNQLQHKLLSADDYSVPGIMPSRITGHCGKPLAEHVNDLSLAFIAPLGTQHYSSLCSHSLPILCCSPCESSAGNFAESCSVWERYSAIAAWPTVP